MRRVVVTGMGIVSSIGNNTQEVLASLREAKSGITPCRGIRQARLPLPGAGHADARSGGVGRPARHALPRPGRGLESRRHGAGDPRFRRRGKRHFQSAHRHRHGLGRSLDRTIVEAADITREKGSPKRIGPFAVPKAMSSTASATLATWFKIKGVNYSISSACATSNHCIGNGTELIQWGKQDMVFAGGSEELSWTMSNLFDAMGAMSSKYNDTPQKASRAYDKDRDGFVIAGGAGVLVLEELEHAKARGAKIYAEVAGYGATSDGYDMVAPSGEGAVRCMKMALETVQGADRLHQSARHRDADRRSQGDRGDPRRVRAEVPADFRDQVADRPFARRRRRAGGDLFAADDATTASSARAPISRTSIPPSPTCRSCASAKDNVTLGAVLSNSFGFGGTNASVVFKRLDA